MGGKQLGHRCAECFAYGDFEQTTARKRTLTSAEGRSWRSH